MTPQESLKKHFGFDAFREGQEDVIIKVLEGKSALAIFPTGAGKSLCFQLSALELDGLTLVISPLIALMKDQLDFLLEHDIPAARLDSTLDREEVFKVYDGMKDGSLKLLYISPERLNNERFLERLKQVKISMLVIDEAHCVSEWGHNFRPDYLKLEALAKELKVERVLNLTATATPEVAQDICKTFDIAAEDVVHTGFHRPNLDLIMNPQPLETRLDELKRRIEEREDGPTIVYVTLQRLAEEVAFALPNAKAYHAGMQDDARAAVQNWFMESDDAIVVATIAFGMGIDKSNIRYVYHYNLSKSLENYAQEIGRAGRDGKPSICETLAYSDDLLILENFIYGDTPTEEALTGLIRDLLSKPKEFDISTYELSNLYDVRPLVVKTLLTYLELDDVLQSTRPFYSVYKFIPNRSSTEMMQGMDDARQTFLRKVFAAATKARTWFSLDLLALEQSGMDRDRVVSALNYLEGKNDLKLQVSGLRNGYRRIKQDVDVEQIIEEQLERFQHREDMDLQRVHEVLDLLRNPSCTTQLLLAHFGEMIEDCGHCAHCRGDAPGDLPEPEELNQVEPDLALIQKMVTADNAAIRHPRQMARFLCGITSPASTKARITKSKNFGSMRSIPFQRVLDAVESVMGG